MIAVRGNARLQALAVSEDVDGADEGDRWSGTERRTDDGAVPRDLSTLEAGPCALPLRGCEAIALAGPTHRIGEGLTGGLDLDVESVGEAQRSYFEVVAEVRDGRDINHGSAGRRGFQQVSDDEFSHTTDHLRSTAEQHPARIGCSLVEGFVMPASCDRVEVSAACPVLQCCRLVALRGEEDLLRQAEHPTDAEDVGRCARR